MHLHCCYTHTQWNSSSNNFHNSNTRFFIVSNRWWWPSGPDGMHGLWGPASDSCVCVCSACVCVCMCVHVWHHGRDSWSSGLSLLFGFCCYHEHMKDRSAIDHITSHHITRNTHMVNTHTHTRTESSMLNYRLLCLDSNGSLEGPRALGEQTCWE